MSEFFLGQIMMSGYAFAPKYFAQCNGQLLPIQQNQPLFSLLGTHYGGDGRTTFGLPDLRGRAPVSFGRSVDPSWQPSPMAIGQNGGSENVTLLGPQLPPHTHMLAATTTAGNTRNVAGAVVGSTGVSLYGDAAGNTVPLNPQTCSLSGGNQSHPNMQPYAVINFCIALSGIFPSRS